MEGYSNVFQYPFSLVHTFEGRGRWHEYFGNDSPIVLELGCGRGEYTVGLARRHPEANFIGVDIKGARMWTGATEALRDGLRNAAFLRTSIELLEHFFDPGEVSELWLTFSDPQMKSPRKRLTSSPFLKRYQLFLAHGGTIHVKTDSTFLYTYTKLLVEHNSLPLLYATDNLYDDASPATAHARAIQTYYESMWMERGIAIKYIAFTLPHEAVITEPEVDIPLDDYRSYSRSKRSPKETGR